MKKLLSFKSLFLLLWMLLLINQVNADSSNSYIFEDGGIDVSGGSLESDSYILDHTLTYDFRNDVATSENYQEISGNTALQVFCGNNIVEPGEECDDGNFVSWDGCSDICKFEAAICGNGITEAWEECDDGNTNNWDGCSNICKNEGGSGSSGGGGWGWGSFIWAVCGNWVIEQNEQCDDWNKTSGDGCSKSCRQEEEKEPEEEEILHFSADGVKEPVCWNGVLELTEECDDGNLSSGDWCNEFCEVEKSEQENQKKKKKETELEEEFFEDIFEVAECGNGILEKGERCDDGNNENNDGCSYRCRIEPKPIIQEPTWEEPVKEEIISKPEEIEGEWNKEELEEKDDLHEVAPLQPKITITMLELSFSFGVFFFFFSDIDFRFRRKKKLFQVFKIK